MAAQQPATTDPTLDLCTRYPLGLWLGGPRQSGIQSLPDTTTHGHTWPHIPTKHVVHESW